MPKSEKEAFEAARSSAKAILDGEGRKGYIPTGKFVSSICSEAEVDRQTAILILDELKENGLTVYVLGKGFTHPETSEGKIVDKPEKEEHPLPQRRVDFLQFLEAIRQ